jgi:hypothetical protein
MQPPPINNDGRRFQSRDGFFVTASGANNTTGETLQSELASGKSEFDKITYQKVGDGWFVLSGYKGSEILYIKAYVGNGSTNRLHIHYLKDLKLKYDAVVGVVAKSFSPGPLNDSH